MRHDATLVNRPTTDSSNPAVDPADLAACLRVLRQIAEDPSLADKVPEVRQSIARAYKRVRKDRRREAERTSRIADRRQMESTGRCKIEPKPAELLTAFAANLSADATVDVAGKAGVTGLTKPRSCYVCKVPFRQLHSFYHLLCPSCAAENFERRTAGANLRGRRALVTGGRIKIGYQLALKLLRDGADVFVTTRFPRDAASRYAAEPDFREWHHRLRIYGLDLRGLPNVYAFAEHLVDKLDGLDILVNNAAQTIRREPSFFRALYERENGTASALPEGARSLLAHLPRTNHEIASATSAPSPTSPAGLELWHWPDDLPYDDAGRPRDPRSTNSWVLELPSVAPAEMVEAMLINAMAPFALCSRLEPLLRRSSFPDRYIVNVSAMEGNFSRGTKTSRHPHTNMAKAALNMLTRTAAERLAEMGIYLNSVDTGWITEENPHPTRARLRTKGFVPPLDEVDGAARVYDPIIRGIRDGERVSGLFLKDYRVAAW